MAGPPPAVLRAQVAAARREIGRVAGDQPEAVGRQQGGNFPQVALHRGEGGKGRGRGALTHQLHRPRGDLHRGNGPGRALPAKHQKPHDAAPGAQVAHRIDAPNRCKMLQQKGVGAEPVGIIDGDADGIRKCFPLHGSRPLSQYPQYSIPGAKSEAGLWHKKYVFFFFLSKKRLTSSSDCNIINKLSPERGTAAAP